MEADKERFLESDEDQRGMYRKVHMLVNLFWYIWKEFSVKFLVVLIKTLYSGSFLWIGIF
jgi:hypothetical protein